MLSGKREKKSTAELESLIFFFSLGKKMSRKKTFYSVYIEASNGMLTKELLENSLSYTANKII